MSRSGIKSVVVVSDVHVPFHCKKATKAFLSFLKDFKPDQLVLNGDILDMAAASSYGDGAEYRLRDELDAGNLFLDLLRETTGPKTRISYNEGNHEERFTKYISKYATAMRGFTDLTRELNLKQRHIDWLPYGKVRFLTPKLGVTHGTLHGANYARETLVKYGMSLIVGHAHRPQLHTMGVAGPDASAVRGVFGLGCLVPVDSVPYMKGPSGWSCGFGVFYTRPDGTFTPYIINMTNQKFVWAGKLYG